MSADSLARCRFVRGPSEAVGRRECDTSTASEGRRTLVAGCQIKGSSMANGATSLRQHRFRRPKLADPAKSGENL